MNCRTEGLRCVDAGSAGVQAGVGDRVNLSEIGAHWVVAARQTCVVPDCSTHRTVSLRMPRIRKARNSEQTATDCLVWSRSRECEPRTVSPENLEHRNDSLEGDYAWGASPDEQVERDEDESAELQSCDEPVELQGEVT